jgi:hypothetical protein
MQTIIINIILGLAGKLLTAEFFEKMVLLAAHGIAKNTDNDLDNETVAAIAEALGKKDWYDKLK